MRVLGAADTRRATGILARAFHDDPVMNWISSNPDFLPTLFDITLPVFIPHGLSHIESSDRGVTAWLGPGTKLQWPMTLANLRRLRKVFGLADFYRFALSGLKTAKHHPTTPHYYLFAIGALPECKGQGVGSLLISRILRQCDREKMPAYLENSKEANLGFYRGHGFEVIKQIRFSKDAPPVWLMWREPQ